MCKLYFGVSKIDMVLPPWILPSWKADWPLTGHYQCTECHPMDALCLREEGERRNHAFWCPLHCSNQKNATISLEISLCKFNSRGKNTAVPFPNWNSPLMCFWEAQMPWRFPSNNNRDCSQLWMVLVDFSSNKTMNHFITSEIAKK